MYLRCSTENKILDKQFIALIENDLLISALTAFSRYSMWIKIFFRISEYQLVLKSH